MNLVEPLHRAEDHQHDFGTDSVMTTAIAKPTKELHGILNRRFRDEHNVLRLEVDVDAFPLVDLRDCHALIEEECGTTRLVHSYIQTTSQDQTKAARHNNLTTRNGTCTGWRFVMVTSRLP